MSPVLHTLRAFAILPGLAFALPALAVNMSVFKDAPVTRLTGEEMKEYRAVIMKALDETPDGGTVEWRAPKTPFTGKIAPRKTFDDGKLKCRETVIESDAHDRAARGVYTLCKGAKGDWQFRSPQAAKK